MAPKTLAPGVRFHPTDVELVKYYLQKKVTGKRIFFELIAEVDVYKFAPSELPDKSHLKSMDLEWFFFCPREKKYANGARMNRATVSGYWKTTGRDRPIIYNDRTVGMIKTLIYHEGRAPQGTRTDWVMHEYRLEDKHLADLGVVQDSYVICKIFLKSGPGPRRTQYLFNEDDWNDDDENISLGAFPLIDSSAPASQNMINPDCSAVTNQYYPGTLSHDTSVELGPSTSIQPGRTNEDGLSLLELPCSSPSFQSLITFQKDVSVLQHPNDLDRHVSEMRKSYTSPIQSQNTMQWNNCLPLELPSDSIMSVSDLLTDNNCVPPTISQREEVFGYSGEHNHGGMLQNHPTPSDYVDAYSGLCNFLDLDDSFIELDDLECPLENELHWSQGLLSDDTIAEPEVSHHHNELPSFHSTDEYGGSICNGLTDPLLLYGSTFESDTYVDTPRKDDGTGSANNVSLCTRKRRRNDQERSNQNGL